jgi:RNA polymerase sigma factor (sigma-70 family)
VNSLTDLQLLRDYAEHRSEAAFGELVRRHVDFVYSAALRMVRDAHLAEDVTQGVFVTLARNAQQLTDHPVLAGWLHRTAQNLAANTVRSDVRRRAREQKAASMNELITAEPDAVWEQIVPHLDAALGELSELDRDALLLRYFQNKSAREMAQILGTSEDVAQKRVSRAVDRLRESFSKRGVTVGTGGLAVVISANAVQAAPAGLAVTISTAAAALAGTTTVATTTATITKAIAMTILQKTVVAATIAATVGAGIYEAHQASTLRDQVQTLQQQQTLLTGQIQQLRREREDASNRLAVATDENTRLKNDSAELVKLREELSRSKTASAEATAAEGDPAQSAAKSWADRVAQLKLRLEQTPGAKIPELKYLTEANWLNAARDPLVTDEDYRRAFASLRSAGENQFIILMHKALQNYLEQNAGQFPADISQLKPYFETTPDDAMLQRYTIVPASSFPNMKMGGDWLITVKNPVDEEYDSLWTLGPQGFGNTSYQGTKEISVLAPAMKTYEDAHNGQEPADPSDLLPYLTTPEQQAAYQKLEQMRKSAGK